MHSSNDLRERKRKTDKAA